MKKNIDSQYFKALVAFVSLIILTSCSSGGDDADAPLNITNLFSSTKAITGELSAEFIMADPLKERFLHPPLTGGFGERGVTYWYHGTIPSNLKGE